MRYFTAGESHGPRLTAIIEGTAGLPLSSEDINVELKRRQGGYGRGGRMLIEDQVLLLSIHACRDPNHVAAPIYRNRYQLSTLAAQSISYWWSKNPNQEGKLDNQTTSRPCRLSRCASNVSNGSVKCLERLQQSETTDATETEMVLAELRWRCHHADCLYVDSANASDKLYTRWKSAWLPAESVKLYHTQSVNKRS